MQIKISHLNKTAPKLCDCHITICKTPSSDGVGSAYEAKMSCAIMTLSHVVGFRSHYRSVAPSLSCKSCVVPNHTCLLLIRLSLNLCMLHSQESYYLIPLRSVLIMWKWFDLFPFLAALFITLTKLTTVFAPFPALQLKQSTEDSTQCFSLKACKWGV